MFRSLLITSSLALSASSAHAGSTTFNLSSLGTSLERHAFIHTPNQFGMDNSLQPEDLQPILFVLHDNESSPDTIERRTGFAETATDHGFIVVFPAGHTSQDGRGFSWSDEKPATQDTEKWTDRGFLSRIVDFLATQEQGDKTRVYIAGFGAGGTKAYDLACDGSGMFSAAISVAGPMMSAHCEASAGLSVLHLHGFEDNQTPYLGGQATPSQTPLESWQPAFDLETVWPDTMSSIRDWGQRLSCGAFASDRPDEDTMCVSSACAGDQQVQMCLSFTAGHEWMGYPHYLGQNRLSADDVSRPALNATTRILSFLDEIALRHAPKIQLHGEEVSNKDSRHP